MDYYVSKSKPKRLLRGLLDWLIADILGLFFCLMSLGFFGYKAAVWFVALAELVLFFGMMFACGQRNGANDRKKSSDIKSFSLKWAFLVACVPVAVPFATLTLQLILQLCGIYSFLPVFKLINIYFMPIIYLFCPDSSVLTMGAGCYAVLFALTVCAFFFVAFIYTNYYKDKALAQKIIFEKEKH